MVYFICGHRGCGKSFLAKEIKKETNCKVFDTGPIIRQVYKQYSGELSFSDWLQYGEKEYGKDFTNELICQNMNIDSSELNIVIGNRTLAGIKYIIDYFKIIDYKICFIDGDIELFRNNYNSRENLNFNSNEFGQVMKLENLMGICDIENFVKQNPDNGMYFYKKQNDSTIADFILSDINLKKDTAKEKILKKKEG